jgi:hypothetical protein
LTPHARETVLVQLKNVRYVGIATDASNHLAVKVFPVIVQYFAVEKGLTVKLLEIKSLPNEKSSALAGYFQFCILLSAALVGRPKLSDMSAVMFKYEQRYYFA